VAFELFRVLRLKNWRAAIAYANALEGHEKGDHEAAIARFERAMRADGLRTSEHIAFYALLMTLSKRPAEDAIQMFTRVAAGEFRGNRDAWRYAEAFAHYWVAFLTSRADMLERWWDAMKLQANEGLRCLLPSAGRRSYGPLRSSGENNPIQLEGGVRFPPIADICQNASLASYA